MGTWRVHDDEGCEENAFQMTIIISYQWHSSKGNLGMARFQKLQQMCFSKVFCFFAGKEINTKRKLLILMCPYKFILYSL